MLIIKEETFGPVIPVMKFATEEEAPLVAEDDKDSAVEQASPEGDNSRHLTGYLGYAWLIRAEQIAHSNSCRN